MKNTTITKVIDTVTALNNEWHTYEEIDTVAHQYGTTAATVKKYSRVVERVIPWDWGADIDLKTKKIYQLW